MRILFFLLLFPLLGRAQPMNLDKLFELFEMRKNESALIKEIKAIGYDKAEEKDRYGLYLAGHQSVIRIAYKEDGYIDGVVYMTRDSTTYAIWPEELEKKEYYYLFTDGNYDMYGLLFGKTMVMVFRNKEYYSLAIVERK